MSGNGRLRALLEARRIENLRLENVRNQCQGILAWFKKELQSVTSTGIQEMQGELQSFTNTLNIIQNRIQNEPDKSLIDLNNLKGDVASIIIEGQAKSAAWEGKKKSWYKNLINAKSSVATLSESKFSIGKKGYSRLVDALSDIETNGMLSDNLERLNAIIEEVNEIHEAIQKESVRREVLKNLKKTLQDLNFQQSKLKKSKTKEGTIELVGKLPTGRSVLFWVHDNGSVDYDFDGYEGTSCKDSLDEMVAVLSKDKELSVSIEQFTWHNPDKLEKGARDMPKGGQVRSRSG